MNIYTNISPSRKRFDEKSYAFSLVICFFPKFAPSFHRETDGAEKPQRRVICENKLQNKITNQQKHINNEKIFTNRGG